MTKDSSGAVARVWSRLPAEARTALQRELSPTDLQTLLMSVARERAARVEPARLMRRWAEDRFVRPSPADPRRIHAIEDWIWGRLPVEFTGVELSPVTPMGTCAAVGAADQNRIVSTMRLTEVVSDPTNPLAIEAAIRRRSGEPEVHLATSHRVLRAQQFSAAGASSHFKLFALVSSGRDTGSKHTEARFLSLHVAFWLTVLAEFLEPGRSEITYTVLDTPVLEQRIADTVRPRLPAGTRFTADPTRTRGLGYYRSLMLQINAVADAPKSAPANDIGDGGFTDWTARLMSDAKERCLISCIAVERLDRPPVS